MLSPFVIFFKGQKILTPLFAAFKIIKPYWREFIIVILGLFIFYQNKSNVRWLLLIDTIPFYQHQLKEIKQTLQQTIDGNKQLSNAIDENNEKLQQLQQISNKLQQHNDKLTQQIDKQKQNTQYTVDQILEQQIEPTCDAAFDFLKNEINELQYE